MLLILTALADIPPHPGFVEKCTLERVARGRECTSCKGVFSGREACEALEKKGFTKQCQTRGASVWTEIHCKGAAPEGIPEAAPATPATPAPATPAPESTSRCDTGAGSGWLWLAAVLPLVTRRR